MPSEIHAKYAAAAALDYGVLLNSLADEAGAKCADITGATAPQVRIWATIVTIVGSDANTLVEFYMARSDGTIQAGGNTTAGSLLWTGDKNTVQFCYALVVDGEAETFSCSFLVDDPGEDWHLIVFNETGDALDSSGSSLRYRYITPEVQ